MLTIGQRIRKYRTDRGISQYDLADGICSTSTISQMESDKFIPSVDILRKLAEKLSIPFHEITVTQESQLEVKVQFEIIKVYIETEEYHYALKLIDEIEQRDDLLKHQLRELVLQRAECLMRTNDTRGALEGLTHLQQKLEKERETDDRLMANLYNKLGSAYYLSGNMVNAYAMYMRAYQISMRFPEMDLLAAYIAYNLGNACRWLGFNSDALVYITQAQKYFGNTLNNRKLAHTQFALGIVYKNLNQMEAASMHLQKSFALYEAENVMQLAQHVRQQYAYDVLANQQPDLAIQELLDCAKEFEKAGNRLQLAYTYARIVSVILDQEKLDEADTYLRLSLQMIEEEMELHDPRSVFVYQVYAKYLLKMNEYGQAIKYALRAAELFNQIGLEREEADVMQLVVEAYRAQGNYQLALEMSEKANSKLRHFLDRRINQ